MIQIYLNFGYLFVSKFSRMSHSDPNDIRVDKMATFSWKTLFVCQIFWKYSRIILEVFWKCSGDILEMKWNQASKPSDKMRDGSWQMATFLLQTIFVCQEYFAQGGILEMFWDYFGGLLEMFRRYSGNEMKSTIKTKW